MKDFIKEHKKDIKLSKELELNSTMSIENTTQKDELSKVNETLTKESDTVNE